MSTLDAMAERRQLGIKMIDRLEKMPRPQKWKVTRDFVLSQNKNLSYQDYMFIDQLQEERSRLLKDTGASASGDVRYLMSMPDFIYAALIAIDPELQDELNDKDKKVSDRAWNKLTAAFPMYQVARKI